jgi:hypothetical protein
MSKFHLSKWVRTNKSFSLLPPYLKIGTNPKQQIFSVEKLEKKIGCSEL